MKTICLYHKDCNDGTTAVAVVMKKYPDTVAFPISHGYSQEDIAPALAVASAGDRILLVDSALGLSEFLDAGHEVTIIDHHVGIEADIKNLAETNPKVTYIFDNDKSGASLTWATLFPDEPAPDIVRYVEDVDLWKWQLGDDSKHVNNYLYLFQNQPEEVMKMFDQNLDVIKEKGAVITQYADKEIDKVSQTLGQIIQIGDYSVPAFNITVYESACGNILSGQTGQAVILYTIKGDEVKMSLRSKDDQTPSALDIAKILGGGGHRNASGAKMSLGDFCQLIKQVVNPIPTAEPMGY